jgi:spermidine/putrescine transport system permease protein
VEAGAATAPASTREERRGAGERLRGRLLDAGLNAYAGLALLYLLAPIAVILVFSFNDPRGRFNFI